MLLILDKIDAVRAGFRSLTETIDTTTPAGRMMKQPCKKVMVLP